MLLQRGVGIKSAGIHIGEVVFFRKIREILLETLSGISKTGGGGETSPRSDNYGIRLLQSFLKPSDQIRYIFWLIFSEKQGVCLPFDTLLSVTVIAAADGRFPGQNP